MAGNAVIRTRFAPSPTGYLHLGHAFSALTAAQLATPGQFLLRIEDIDTERCRPEYEQAIYDDLAWLGLSWQTPVMRQSERMETYQAALEHLIGLGLCYPCSCTRGDIKAALSAPQEGAPVMGPDGVVYPGTCRARKMSDAAQGNVIRLNAARAFDLLWIDRLSYDEEGENPGRRNLLRWQFESEIGDIILARRGMGTSYHLSVVLDDAAQDIALVTRGADLADATWIHLLLQQLLDLPTPRYHHHRLIRDEEGRRLAKRDDARAIRRYRAEGATPEELRRAVGL